MADPSVLLLDEPSAGLSPALQDQVFVNCRRINSAGISIVMVEQNARRCLQICHRGLRAGPGPERLHGYRSRAHPRPEASSSCTWGRSRRWTDRGSGQRARRRAGGLEEARPGPPADPEVTSGPHGARLVRGGGRHGHLHAPARRTVCEKWSPRHQPRRRRLARQLATVQGRPPRPRAPGVGLGRVDLRLRPPGAVRTDDVARPRVVGCRAVLGQVRHRHAHRHGAGRPAPPGSS